MLQYIKDSGSHCIDTATLENKLHETVKASITQNKAEWEKGYICKLSQYFNNGNSVFYADNKDIADYECEYIEGTQHTDGLWNIPWEWSDYPEQWALSENWWKSNGIILNLIYLDNFGKSV